MPFLITLEGPSYDERLFTSSNTTTCRTFNSFFNHPNIDTLTAGQQCIDNAFASINTFTTCYTLDKATTPFARLIPPLDPIRSTFPGS
ncbi:hypothetical protein HK097_009906 [Rhizophlyctis rosea]|uniref:Uncharacterized protein n=1 Tax=Rhizophlyctis rosea TaxID=64517 RepID=A0AAD5S892_9FUNG|nr:hypothetical protein HK097_009906 [Rhizophlyctis rosea]